MSKTRATPLGHGPAEIGAAVRSRSSGDGGTVQRYWQLARPFTLLLPLMGMLSGATMAAAAHRLADARDLPVGLGVALGAVSATALAAASNILNQIYDVDIDRVNKPGRPLASGEVRRRDAAVLCAVLFALALAAAWPAGPTHEVFLLVLAGALCGVVYSVPPMRTKRLPWLAPLTIALPRGLLLTACGWATVASVADDPEPWYLGTVVFLFLLGASTTKDYADVRGDTAGGCRTLPVVFGLRRAVLIICPFMIVPWLLLPLGALLGRGDGRPLLTGDPLVISALGVALALHGGFVVRLLLRDPAGLATEHNHPSWTHMYAMVMVFQLGLASAYVLPVV
jgi:geranylgeranylglycerol-phosphate geranylgeranyltransferase